MVHELKLMCTYNVGENVDIILHMPNYILYIKSHPLNYFYGGERGGGEEIFKVSKYPV